MSGDLVSQERPRIVVASKTVQGYSHLVKGTVCQDASLARADEDGGWRIVIVSDGHGDHNCPRSDRGSRLAVEVTAQSLSEFAQGAGEPDATGHTLMDDLRVHARQGTVVRRLTDAILARWLAAVHEDLQEHPLADDDLAQVDDRYRTRYQSGERLEHAYGATLVCALWLPEVLLLIQQGDGLCLVLDAGGNVSRPIPEDERCFANETTSLCDVDVADAIRHAVVDLAEQPLAAVVLGSDGVENSFAKGGGVEGYAKDLLVNLAQDGDASRLADELDEGLPELSRCGSGDDMSVALAADVEAIQALSEAFRKEVARQKLEGQIAALQDKLISMGRKHTALEQQRNVAVAERERLEEALEASRAKLDEARAELEQQRGRLDGLARQRDELSASVEAKRARLGDRPPARPLIKIGDFEVMLPDPAGRALAKLERELAEVMVAHDEAYERYDALVDDGRAAASEVEDAEEALATFDDTPVSAYEEYDAQYVRIQIELVARQAELAKLDDDGEE